MEGLGGLFCHDGRPGAAVQVEAGATLDLLPEALWEALGKMVPFPLRLGDPME